MAAKIKDGRQNRRNLLVLFYNSGREMGLSPPVKYFTNRSNAVLQLLNFLYVFFCLVFVMPLCASVYLCLVITCWERADVLALVCGV